MTAAARLAGREDIAMSLPALNEARAWLALPDVVALALADILETICAVFASEKGKAPTRQDILRRWTRDDLAAEIDEAVRRDRPQRNSNNIRRWLDSLAAAHKKG